MNDLIKNKLSLLPSSPGCYLMKDKEGTIIYVGKAKKLKNRVHSYFVGVHNYKTTKLVSEIVDFEYIVTDSEKEALLLEINLIKDYAPKYNIMFMDNTYYPYIQMTNERHPRLKIVRNAKEKKAKHFGPFPDATAARETYKLLDRLYPLRKCNHIPKKPCLYYSLNQCLAPCIQEVDEDVYTDIKKSIVKLLNGDIKDKVNELTEKMNKASEELNFEQAKEYRDLISHIRYVTAKQHVQFNDQVDRDILGYYVDHGYLSIQLFFMRNGKLLSRDLNLVPISENVQDDLQQFIVSFYQSNTLPKEILLPQDVDDELLKEILDCKILKPQKGNKHSLVQMAIENAKESLEKKFQLMQKNEAATIGAMKQLGELLNIPTPHVIELFDNSNIQGAYAVAGMVCFKDGVPSKKDYRKYKIKTVEGPDDYGSMREVIYRRYYRVLMEGLTPPDMVIVDGGLGQIHVAKEVIESLNLPIQICGLAKDDKHSTAMLLDSEGKTIPIHPKSELFFLLTRMQDEVHRYAISFHKNVRSKSLFASLLDNVEGIGPKRKKQLLNHFKSVKKMKEASLEELKELLPEKVAEELFESLHLE
ncbi:MAG: excinuclease ABC subunit UvrC [Coprobacillus cateniformis]|uniref:UvrABC system protein C n=1 Tax=Longibaculum muris TaxID=1796628 RepID=A0A4R3Z703_9FIRM|nr:excinuclease ABC subunit UvrC [Longibaculum muris]KXU44776.1 excinuclease ABC, C subunit [Candidatus Stoquefichus sp. KLE1796]MBS5113775.1 excinuclease ABC subunit UvrC [Coprobacillus cateniformis]MBS5368865.1 excinuclease ABC subunit UvrC [Coprobacillus cateniformis]MCR1887891.1 excinuclease ABC subunit UvrC [Longibaculum muris]MED9812158.1 excinuclease ABC subunit UvrC [Longibaculum muris]